MVALVEVAARVRAVPVNPLYLFFGLVALVVVGALIDAATGGRISAWLKRYS